MSKNRGFFTVTSRHMHLPGLTNCQVLLLCRMSSFGVCFESPKNAARFLNRAEKTLQIARQGLARDGYIFELENNGRGKKYLVRADLRQHELTAKDLKTIEKIKAKASADGKPLNIPPQFLDKAEAEKMFPVYEQEPTKDEEPEQIISPLRASKGDSKPRVSSAEREARSEKKWNEAHPDLIPVLKLAERYLDGYGIPLFDYPKFRKELAIVARTLEHPDDPERPSRILTQYLEYIDGDEYWYQVEHNKFVPRISNQDDLWRKFAQIREFKSDKARHYDPSKVLT